jgi:mono/diheme cytochrome c family protein
MLRPVPNRIGTIALVLGLAGAAYGVSSYAQSDETSHQSSNEPETNHSVQGHSHVEHQAGKPNRQSSETPEHAHHHGAHSRWSVPPEAASRLNSVFADKKSVARGEAIFHYRCVGCHGAGARGDGPIAPALDPRPVDLVAMVPHHTDGDLAWKIANGRGSMPGWKQVLTEDQVWDLINFLRALVRERCC